MFRDHVLIVAENPDQPDSYHYTVECPGPSPDCEAWTTCDTTDCHFRNLGPDRDGQPDPIQHGTEHRLIGDEWMIRAAGECYVAGHHRLPAAAAINDLTPGRYAIKWFVGDGTELGILRARYVLPACGHLSRETLPRMIKIDDTQPRVCTKCRPDHPQAVGESQGLALMPVVYYNECPPELLPA